MYILQVELVIVNDGIKKFANDALDTVNGLGQKAKDAIQDIYGLLQWYWYFHGSFYKSFKGDGITLVLFFPPFCELFH